MMLQKHGVSPTSISGELETSRAPQFDDSVWPLDKVHRVATMALGLSTPQGVVQLDKALELISASDAVKYSWMYHEKQAAKKDCNG
jgi:hypothetical protein